MRRAILLAGACVAVLSLGHAPAAFAADAAEEAAPVAAIQEVVVTAERRTQSVQKSSLAISVITAEAAKEAGLSQARDLTKLSPGVQIGQGGPATQIYVRGVGDFGSTPITNPAVAINVDGVYVARANSVEGNFFDLQRIEVLKGPQGTLYGRNATGGAINILSNPPRLGEFSGNVEGEIGNFDLRKASGAINVPVSDTVALRAAFEVVRRDGYATQGFDDDHHEAFRVSALWKPNDDFSLRGTVHYAHVGGMGPAYVIKGPLNPGIAALAASRGVSVPSNPRTNTTDPAYANLLYAVSGPGGANLCLPNALLPAARSAAGPVPIPAAPQGFCGAGFSTLLAAPLLSTAGTDNKNTNFTAEANWNVGFATLTVIPAYRRVRNNYVTYPFIDYHNGPEKSDAYSLETRLGNSGERLTWVVGGYYFREDQDAYTAPAPNSILFGNNAIASRIKTESTAVFGQATVNISEAFRVIGGLRYTHDEKGIDGFNVIFAPPGSFQYLPLPNNLCFNRGPTCVKDRYIGSKTWNPVTFKVGVEYDLTSQNMLFATYGTGQKAGGFNSFSAFGSTTNEALGYDPEKLAAVEVGSRNRFFDSRLQVNAEAFYWKYRDAQESFGTQDAVGNSQFGTTNAGQAVIYGVDLDVVAKLSPVDTIRGNIEYLHTNFERFVYRANGVSPPGTGCTITATPLTRGASQLIDCTGKPLLRSPKFSGSVGYIHTFELGDGSEVDATLSGQFATSRFLDGAYNPSAKAKGYFVSDASLTYRSQDKNWQVTGYVRNITKELVYTGAFSSTLLPSLILANVAAPRTYGVRVGVDF